MNKRIYLDHSATTPIDPEVFHFFMQACEQVWGNPSSVHREGQEARGALLEAKRKIGALLQVPASHDVYFFSSATEALNTLIFGVCHEAKKSLAKKGRGLSILSTKVEHAAVYEPICALTQDGEITASYSDISSHGTVRLQDVQQQVQREREASRKAVCAVYMAVNNETGVVTEELSEIAAFLHGEGVPLIVDGVAMLGKAPLPNLEGISAIVFSGHKIHAPKGVAVALVDKRLRFIPLILGGPQESRKRAGTENIAACMAFAYALEKAVLHLEKDRVHLLRLQKRFESALLSRLTNISINGEGSRIPAVSNIAFHGLYGEDLLMSLDLMGLAASHGSACSSGALEPSRVLLNMGYSFERASSSIRFSMSRMTTEEEIDQAIEIIVRTVASMK